MPWPEFVLRFVRDENLDRLAACVVIVEPGRVRVRKPPLRTDGPEWMVIPLPPSP